MPCFHCHVFIKLPASHSAFMLGTKKTWPNKIKRRLGIPVATRTEANRRAAVRAGNSRAVTASGAQALITLNGLTNDTQYRVSFLHRDAHRNDSAVVSQTVIPTTGASNIVTPIVDGFTIGAMASVPAVTPTAIADGFLIEDA